LTERLRLKAGYEAMWLEGVALAPAQISRTMSHSVPTTDVYVQPVASAATPVRSFTAPPSAWNMRFSTVSSRRLSRGTAASVGIASA